MPSLQIRNLPEDVYEILALRARREQRSLAQQAVADLRRLPELEAKEGRLQVLARIRKEFGMKVPTQAYSPPEDLIRQDRAR